MINIGKVEAELDPEVRKLWLRVLPRLLEVPGEPGERPEASGARVGAVAQQGRIPAIQGTSA